MRKLAILPAERWCGEESQIDQEYAPRRDVLWQEVAFSEIQLLLSRLARVDSTTTKQVPKLAFRFKPSWLESFKILAPPDRTNTILAPQRSFFVRSLARSFVAK